ncbi:hypothetical protein JCM24511_10093 [Saitozyma sp. JCM 24511]|nr:hypothetical protein JCM24511_10093 [Saitozyma sp. JCM 24511]
MATEYLFVGVERWSGIVFALPNRSRAEAMRVVKEALAKIERQLGDKVCVIRSDGGTEFDNGEAMMWCRITEIQHYTSPRYTPELNGAAKGWYAHLGRSPVLTVDSNSPPRTGHMCTIRNGSPNEDVSTESMSIDKH